MQIEKYFVLFFIPGLACIMFLLLSSLACSQVMFPLHSEIGIIFDLVLGVCVELFTMKAEVLPLEIWQLHSGLFILSLLSGSLQQGLEYIKNLWVLSGRQLRSVFLQPIRGADLVPESTYQRVQTLCGLQCLAVQQHKLLSGQRACVRNRAILLLQLVG